MNLPQYSYCLGCGRGFSARLPDSPLPPSPVARATAPVEARPTVMRTPFSEQSHPWLRRLAWATWTLALLTLPALFVGLWQAVEFDQRHDYVQGAALQVALLFLLYVVTAAGIVLFVTALATNDLRSQQVQVLAGMACWFLAVQFVAVFAIALVAGLIKPAKSTEFVCGLFGRLAGGAAAVLILVIAGAFVGFVPPLGLAWLVVMVWAPIRLATAGRRETRRLESGASPG